MSMHFDNERPIYLQLADLIREAIMSGELAVAEPIPSVRRLSTQYRLNPQTILNATQILVNEGLLEKQRGLGYFVSEKAPKILRKSGYKNFVQQSVPELVRQAKILEIDSEQLFALIEHLYEEKKEG